MNIKQIEEATAGSYSWDRYSRTGWTAAIKALLKAGYTAEQVVEVMNSKITRWAADMDETRSYGRYNSVTVLNGLKRMNLTPANINEFLS